MNKYKYDKSYDKQNNDDSYIPPLEMGYQVLESHQEIINGIEVRVITKSNILEFSMPSVSENNKDKI